MKPMDKDNFWGRNVSKLNCHLRIIVYNLKFSFALATMTCGAPFLRGKFGEKLHNYPVSYPR